MNALGRYIRLRARERGLSLAEVARRAGLSRQTLHALSSHGGRSPDLATLARVAVELDVHPLRLIESFFEDFPLSLSQERQHGLRGDKSVFIADVTIPDGMIVGLGARFTKVWELQNVGTVAWEGRVLRCLDEDLVVKRRGAHGAGELIPITERLLPTATQIDVPYTPAGGSVRLAVDFVAPQLPGTCISYWKSYFVDGTPCFPDAAGLSCKVRVMSMKAAQRNA